MKLKIKVSDHTTAAELRLLGTFFTGLADQYATTTFSAFATDPEVFTAPTDEAEVVQAPDQTPPVVTDQASFDAAHSPKRKRRTKAEIEADVAAAASYEAAKASAEAAAAAKPVDVVEPEVAPEPEVVVEPEVAPEPNPTSSPAPTPTAQETANGAAETPATESPSDTKTYTPAEVQKIAVATAGRFGPEKVKAIIAQYPGAARIADLPLTELAGFVAKLNAVS